MSRRKTPFKFVVHVSDHVADTMHLSAAEHGAYLRLLFAYWRSGPPQDDNRVLARIAGVTAAEWREIRRTVEPFFEVADGRWVHPQTDIELEAAYDAINKASRAGKAAARVRWDQARDRDGDRTVNTDADALRHACDSQLQQKDRGAAPDNPRPSQSREDRDSALETADGHAFAGCIDVLEHELRVGGVQ